jgi:TolB-like protein/cytochrome c-type biogenesis protein CcmH/NrfG
MPARLQTLGHLRLLDEGGSDIVFPEKALLILGYLQTRGVSDMPRADAAALFWDDANSAAAFANLRQTVSRAQKRQRELGRTYLTFTDTTIALGPQTIESDIDAVHDGAGIAVLASTLTDDFLKYVKPGNRALSSWIMLQRAAHTALLRNALLDSNAPDGAGTRQARATAALRLLESNPDDEEVRAVLTGRPAPSASLMTLRPPARVLTPQEADIALPRQNPPRVVLLPPVTTLAARAAGRFSEALIEDVTIGLCALRSISIIAPHTAAQISLQSDRAATYERHKISYILETRLRDEGDHHTFFAQLIFFGSDEVIWAERFPLSAQGLARSRQMISHQIAGAIATEIERNELVRGDYERDADAYRSFLIGQSQLKNLDLRDIRRARKSFREALQINGGFAPALGGLARSYFLEWLVTARGDEDLLRQAERHAEETIRADDRLPSGYRELGVVKLYARQFDESAAYLDRAEALSPHYANVIASYADTLVQASRPDVGLKKIEHAIELNPLPPDEYFWTAASAAYSLGKYEEAIAFIARMKDKDPVHRLTAACWAMLGDLRKARLFVRRTYDINPNFDFEAWMAVVPIKEEWHRQHYRDGLKKAGF